MLMEVYGLQENATLCKGRNLQIFVQYIELYGSVKQTFVVYMMPKQVHLSVRLYGYKLTNSLRHWFPQ